MSTANKDLIQRYERLKNTLDMLRIERAKAEATVNTLTNQRVVLEQQVLELTKTTSLEEAEAKVAKAIEVVNKKLTEAEVYLNETDE